MSDYCLTSNKQFVSCIVVRTYEFHSVDDVCIVLDQHAKLYFFSAILLKQLSVGRHVAPLKTNYPDSETNQYLLLLLNDACLAEKQQIPMLWCLV